jgi:hypothetical protein
VEILLHPTPISLNPAIFYLAMKQSENITFEIEIISETDKAPIALIFINSNGVQLLNIPVKAFERSHQKTEDIKNRN